MNNIKIGDKFIIPKDIGFYQLNTVVSRRYSPSYTIKPIKATIIEIESKLPHYLIIDLEHGDYYFGEVSRMKLVFYSNELMELTPSFLNTSSKYISATSSYEALPSVHLMSDMYKILLPLTEDVCKILDHIETACSNHKTNIEEIQKRLNDEVLNVKHDTIEFSLYDESLTSLIDGIKRR